MAWGFVQAAKAFGVGITSVTATFASNCTTNNRIIACGGSGNVDSGTLNAPTDGAGNTYNVDKVDNSLSIVASQVASTNITAGGGTKIAVTQTVSALDSVDLSILEYSGLGTGSNIVQTTGDTQGSSATTAHTATTGANCLAGQLVVFFNHDDGNGGSQTASNGITIRQSDTLDAYTSSIGDKSAAGGATETGGVTTGNSITYVGLIVAYQLAAVASAIPFVSRIRDRWDLARVWEALR